MHSARKQKTMIVFAIIFGSAAAVGLMLYAFDQGLNAFFTPSEVAEGKVAEGQHFRIGGMVKEGSVIRQGLEGTRIEFATTDYAYDVPVVYAGILPDLFREGQGVVAEGVLDENGVFHADMILAKHDENYMSAEVKEALDAAERNRVAAAAEVAN